MTEKRYYKKEYEEEYYIFDSNTLTEKEFEKKVEYEGYDVFADSLTPEEVVDLLNENEKLKEEKCAYLGEITLYKGEANKRKKENEKLKKENKQLKKELFQSEKEYLYEAYSGNSVRRDNKIKALEDEFNERFGDDMND